MYLLKYFVVALFLSFITPATQAVENNPLNFGVINQRSVTLTAQTWNPILTYVNNKLNINLVLSMGKTATETTALTLQGKHAFAYTNHMFTPERDRIGYKAILRISGEPIHSAIVLNTDSPIRSIHELKGLKVAFPSREAFVGYWVPMDHLLKSGIQVNEVLAGNQEGAMSQLQHGQVSAAAVNSKILSGYAKRENFDYRILWTSEPFFDIPVMVHPDVSPQLVKAIRKTFIGMSDDVEGQLALQASADALGSKMLWSFVLAEDSDYDNYRRFFRSTIVKAE